MCVDFIGKVMSANGPTTAIEIKCICEVGCPCMQATAICGEPGLYMHTMPFRIQNPPNWQFLTTMM